MSSKTSDLNNNADTFYELFLLRQLQLEEAKAHAASPRRTSRDITKHLECHLYHHCDWDSGLTDEQILAYYYTRQQLRDMIITSWQPYHPSQTLAKRLAEFDSSTPQQTGEITDAERDRILSHRSEFCHENNGEYRWYKEIAHDTAAKTYATAYMPCLDRAVLLADPKLTLAEHEELGTLLNGLWTLLYGCRQRYKSPEKGFVAINGVMTGVKALTEILSQELNDMLGEPQNADNLYTNIEPTPPTRIKKGDLAAVKGLRLDLETHALLAETINLIWATLVQYRHRYTFEADLQRRAISEMLTAMADLARNMDSEVVKNTKDALYTRIISGRRS